MSPPRKAARGCDVVQAELHALLLDGEQPNVEIDELWSHVDACSRCARAIAHDVAMRRALARVRRSTAASESLRRRVLDALEGRATKGTRAEGRSRSS